MFKKKRQPLKCPECGCERIAEFRTSEEDDSLHTSAGDMLIQCQLCDFIFAVDVDVNLSRTPVEKPGSEIADNRTCPNCGYNLRTLAVGGRCPECGTTIKAQRPRSVHTPEDAASDRGMPLWFHISMIAVMCVGFWYRKSPFGAAAIFAAMAAQAGAEGVIVVMRRRVRIGGRLFGKIHVGIRAVLHGVAAILFALFLLTLSVLLWFGRITPAQIGL